MLVQHHPAADVGYKLVSGLGTVISGCLARAILSIGVGGNPSQGYSTYLLNNFPHIPCYASKR